MSVHHFVSIIAQLPLKHIPRLEVWLISHRFWYGVVTFGMGLRIPDNEIALCRELMADAWIAVALQNDMCSWPKERDHAALKGYDSVINAIWVLMQERNVDAARAEEICRQLTKEHVAKYLRTIEATRHDESLSQDLRKYIEAFQYAISGNVVWSLNCPRYNPSVNFNDDQLEAMCHVAPTPSSTPSTAETPSDSSSDSVSFRPPSSQSSFDEVLTPERYKSRKPFGQLHAEVRPSATRKAPLSPS